MLRTLDLLTTAVPKRGHTSGFALRTVLPYRTTAAGLRGLAVAMALGLLAGCDRPYEHLPAYQPAEMDAALAAQKPDADLPDWLNQPPAPATALAANLDLDRPLSLDDCLRLALQSDRQVRMADRRVLIARDRVDEAVAAVNPTLDFTGRYDIRSNDMGSKNGAQGFAFGNRHSGSGSLNLLVPIYDFGGSTNVKKALDQGIGVSALQAQAQRQATALAVRLAFYRVLEARSIEQVVRDSRAVVARQLAIARDFHAQGLVANNDVLAADVQQAQRDDEVLQAESNVAMAIATLNRLLGLDVSRPTQLQDAVAVPVWTDSYVTTLGLAIERRPELRGLKKQIDMARTEYDAMLYGGRSPNLYAYGSYNGSTDDTLLNQQWLSGGVGLRFPLFDGGLTNARLVRKTKEIAELIDLHDERIDDVVLSVKQAWLQTHALEQRLPVARKAVKLARENLAVTMDRYQQGLATSADVLAEEDRLARTAGMVSRAIYAYNEAYARLINAIGADLPGELEQALNDRNPAPPAEIAEPPATGGRAPGAAPEMDATAAPATADSKPDEATGKTDEDPNHEE